MGNSEIDPRLKAELNAEGWQSEDEKSGADLFIGNEDERMLARERREHELREGEGSAADLATYIRLHKKVLGPISEVGSLAKDGYLSEEDAKFIADQFPKMKGLVTARIGFDSKIEYIDKEGSITGFDLDKEKVASLKNVSLRQSLVDIGFHESDDNFKYDVGFVNQLEKQGIPEEKITQHTLEIKWAAERLTKAYQKKLEKDSSLKQGEEFNF